MILVLLLAFIVLMPLVLWRDWLDAQAINNPELHTTIVRVLQIVLLLGFLWFVFTAMTPDPPTTNYTNWK